MRYIHATLSKIHVTLSRIFAVTITVASFILAIFVSILFLGCKDANRVTRIQVDVNLAEQSVACEEQLDLQNGLWRVQSFSWFMSRIELKTQEGWYTPKMVDNALQHSGAVLIEADNCKRGPAIELAENVDWQNVSAMRFQLGLPFQLNHANPLQQPEPINRSDMFWSWQTGHKFFRLDLDSDNTSWVFHLGSTGCGSASAMRAPEKACKQPNVFKFEVATHLKKGRLVLNLDALLSELTLATDSGCRFQASQAPSCRLMLTNLASDNVFTWQ